MLYMGVIVKVKLQILYFPRVVSASIYTYIYIVQHVLDYFLFGGSCLDSALL